MTDAYWNCMSKLIPFFALIALIVLIFSGKATAELQGSQSGKWTLASSPYIVSGDIWVPRGSTLLIEPGVVIKFRGRHSFVVEGNLIAVGRPRNPIIFTSINDRDFFGMLADQAAEPEAGDWHGIWVRRNGAQSKLANVVIRFGRNSLSIEETIRELENVVIEHSSDTVVAINNAPVPIQQGFGLSYSFKSRPAVNDVLLTNSSPRPSNRVLVQATKRQTLFDDLSVRYSFVRITKAVLGGMVVRPTFNRHLLDISAGLDVGPGQASAGLLMQRVTTQAENPGTAENGYMLTVGYDLPVAPRLRLEFQSRVALDSDTDPGQPSFASHTDFALDLVAFDVDGVALLRGQPIFPSAHGGLDVNKYGRIQFIGGFGAWWNGITFYLSGYHAVNGVENPLEPGKYINERYAFLQNTGVSFTASYEFRSMLMTLKYNHPIKNSGNDLAFSLQYRYRMRK